MKEIFNIKIMEDKDYLRNKRSISMIYMVEEKGIEYCKTYILSQNDESKPFIDYLIFTIPREVALIKAQLKKGEELTHEERQYVVNSLRIDMGKVS